MNGERKTMLNINQKKVGVAIVIQAEQTSRQGELWENKEGNYTIVKRSIFQKDKKNLYMFVPNNKASNYMRQKLIKLGREIDESIIMAGDFNSPLSEIHRFSNQKNQSKHNKLSKTTNQLYIMDIYRLFQPRATEYKFF